MVGGGNKFSVQVYKSLRMLELTLVTFELCLQKMQGSQEEKISIPKAQYLDPYSKFYVHCAVKCATMKNWT